MKSICEIRTNKDQNQKHMVKKSGFKRVVVTLVAVIAFAAICIPTALTYGSDIFTPEQDRVATPVISPEPGFESVAESGGNYVKLLRESENYGFLESNGYLFSLAERDGDLILKDIYAHNGDAILMTPENSNGFTLQKGEEVGLYISLTASSELNPGHRASVEIGLVTDGIMYETYTGRVNVNGETVAITAPNDGEFKVYIKNVGSDPQYYKELSVTLFNGNCSGI